MAQDIIRDFVIEPAVAAAGQEVTLKAMLEIPLSQLPRGQFRFVSPESSTITHHPDPNNERVALATWPASGKAPIEKLRFQALIREGQKIVEAEPGYVTVISSVELKVNIRPTDPIMEGAAADVEVSIDRFDLAYLEDFNLGLAWFIDGAPVQLQEQAPDSYVMDTTGLVSKTHTLMAKIVDGSGTPIVLHGKEIVASDNFDVTTRPISRLDTLKVSLQRSSATPTRDQALWALIRDRTLALSFSQRSFTTFVDAVLGDGTPISFPSQHQDRVRDLTTRATTMRTQAFGVAAYELLKAATEVFLLINCGVAPADSFKDGFHPEDEAARGYPITDAADLRRHLSEYFPSGRLPYLDRIVRAVFPGGDANSTTFFRPNALSFRVNAPCLLELIWSYWHEEGMLVQTMNAISRRFQNMRAPGERDPLAHLEIDPLRPLNNLLWGYIQDETNLLTVKRRAYEYDHHYGLTIYGKAVPTLRPADSRSKFLEAFHNLLHMTAVFYKEDNDTTVIADGFPLLNALREVHLLLAQGAHNQFGDLPWTARTEMLMQQWLLARPEMREFLQSRPMVPYKEGWMSQVDTMKTLQGWSDVTVTHFRDLGVYGEQILLTIRYGDWIDVNDENSAKNWARYWRPEVQGYLHAYRAVTGVDLTNPEGVDYTMPAVHLQKRLAMQRTR